MNGTRASGVRTSGIVALVVASVLWGTTGTTATLFPDDVDPLAIGAATMGIGGLLLFGTAPRASLAVLRDSAARRWLALGALGVFVYPLAFYWGMDLVGVAIGNVIALGSGPIVAAVLERAFEREPWTGRWFVSAALAIGGIALLAVGREPGESSPTPGEAIAGVGLGVLAGSAYGLYAYSSSRAIRVGQPSRGVMGGMFGLGALLLLPVLVASGAPLLQSSGTVAISAYLAIGPMFVAYLLFGIGLRSVRSSVATTVTLLEPVIATILAVFVVGERLALPGWLGLVLVLAGLCILVTARRRGKRDPRP